MLKRSILLLHTKKKVWIQQIVKKIHLASAWTYFIVLVEEPRKNLEFISKYNCGS